MTALSFPYERFLLVFNSCLYLTRNCQQNLRQRYSRFEAVFEINPSYFVPSVFWKSEFSVYIFPK